MPKAAAWIFDLTLSFQGEFQRNQPTKKPYTFNDDMGAAVISRNCY